MIDRKAIPLYYQLETLLKGKILSGELAPGDRLPVEDELMQEYQVSRITIRRALTAMEQEGLIDRQRGKGTFVKRSPLVVEAPRLMGSIEDLLIMVENTTTRIIDFGLAMVSRSISDHLDLPEGAGAVRIERIRLLNDSPLSYVLNYLPRPIGEKVQPDALLSKPLLKILEDDLGVELAHAAQTIGCTIADTHVASLLQVRVGDPLLKVERIVYDRNRRPVEYVSVLYRGDKFFYKVNLSREKNKNLTGWNLV